ncbi:MAG: BtpA/SgcQ family protein, partial [Candidatus Eisenbacteria bacterium]|nr:BtpA/SgcQ family protein [Candidatus Eisenbacteria bacterium]
MSPSTILEQAGFPADAGRPLLFGMVHLGPLPGSPRDPEDFEATLRAASADLDALVGGGADGAIVENFGDAPFLPDAVPPVTVAAMTVAAARLRAQAPGAFLLGVNVLRNDAAAALSIAAVTGASCIRVNVHLGAAVTDQGILRGRADETLRLRRALGRPVAIFADVDVKHAAPVAARPVEEEALDLVERGLADVQHVTRP